MADVPFLSSTALDGAVHGFFGRRGGASEGMFESLNVGLGSQDDRNVVFENRRRAVDALIPGASLATLFQVHSARVVTLSEAPALGARPEADAIVTDRPGLLLGILTADCVPVLYYEPEAGIVGAAHSGWQGALKGVNEATLEAMEALGARRDRIAAAIGPAIAQASYEVDHGFRDRFTAAAPDNAQFFAKGRADRYQFDLTGYVVARLAVAGVRKVDHLDIDTYAHDADYFSYRRTTHRGEPDYGRQLSAIGLPLA